MQHDFASPGGMFNRAGIDISGVRGAVAPTARVLDGARDIGLPVIYLQMQHRPDLAEIGPQGSAHRERHARLSVGETVASPSRPVGRTLIAGEWGTQIVAQLQPAPGDIVGPEPWFSGFFESPLHGILQTLDVRTLIFTGCTTSICVEATLRHAMYRDYRCVLLEDCTAEPIGQGNVRSNHDTSLLVIETLIGWVSDSSAFLRAVAT